MKKIIVAAAIATGVFASAAQAEKGIKVGMLTCGVDGGIGYIVGSSKAMDFS